ncbi:hypothetical protein PtA15_4A548 [Puccinia triticina]|uniref:Uncharacterized protein n=1 Tax=Puccinia triticina TaxID=208348 RepID=A0ABY7CHZ4_9BASI|nr:uncharacterized protein PtA15_4A548 [Puccinia triticina]WAQ84097.1 hypothetical protein PtA15_4A548 [Puccinia triticina]
MVRVFKQQLVLAGVAAALMARPEDPPSAPQGAAEHPEAAVPAHPNLIFASFAGLLQQWPNTFAYAGHSIVPGEVPRGTLLYHATTTTTTSAGRPPPAPDQGPMKWLAFDPEYSYVIHSRRTGLLDLHTYAAARALRILYLDGQSASLGSPGFMDSQDVLLNRTVAQNIQEPDYLDAEYHRARMLCQLGKRWGFEGVVRMNTCFELLWCDMSQGLQLLARTNITDPYDTHPEPTEEPDQSSAKLSGHPPPDPPVGQHPAPDTTSPVCPADLRVQHPFQRAPELSELSSADGTAGLIGMGCRGGQGDAGLTKWAQKPGREERRTKGC